MSWLLSRGRESCGARTAVSASSELNITSQAPPNSTHCACPTLDMAFRPLLRQVSSLDKMQDGVLTSFSAPLSPPWPPFRPPQSSHQEPWFWNPWGKYIDSDGPRYQPAAPPPVQIRRSSPLTTGHRVFVNLRDSENANMVPPGMQFRECIGWFIGEERRRYLIRDA